MEELRDVLSFKMEKAPSSDNIPAVLISYGVPEMLTRIHRLIVEVWESGHACAY